MRFAVSGLALSVPPLGDEGVLDPEPVGPASGELALEVGADEGVLGTVVGAAVGSAGVGCAVEADASGCADALTEADGEEDGDTEALASVEGLAFPRVAVGFTTPVQSLGLDGGGGVCLRPSSDALLVSGFGSSLAMPGMGFGTTPASMAAR